MAHKVIDLGYVPYTHRTMKLDDSYRFSLPSSHLPQYNHRSFIFFLPFSAISIFALLDMFHAVSCLYRECNKSIFNTFGSHLLDALGVQPGMGGNIINAFNFFLNPDFQVYQPYKFVACLYSTVLW